MEKKMLKHHWECIEMAIMESHMDEGEIWDALEYVGAYIESVVNADT